MKMNLTPNVEKVKKPRVPRVKKEVPHVELADTASTITRKREGAKRAKRVEAPANIPVEIGSAFEREANNQTRDIENILPVGIDSDYGEIINPNNYQETADRIQRLEQDGTLRLEEVVGMDDFGTDTYEDEQRELGHAAKNVEFSTPHSDIRRDTTRNSLLPYRQENMKTLSDSKKERNNRGRIGKLWDKIINYVSPKDLYDEEEEVDKFTALGRQYEKEQEEKAAREYQIRYSAPENLPVDDTPDERMVA